jgi:hypothetical protein
MILGFRTEFNGKPTGFVEKIISGVKIHSMREGNRWRIGMPIQFATGVRTKQYNQFKEGRCSFIQYVTLYPKYKRAMMGTPSKSWLPSNYSLSNQQIELLAKNDGFDSVEDFWEWFGGEEKTYQLIHWTDLKY